MIVIPRMTFEQRVEKQLSLKPDSEELLALWKRIWSAYDNGGAKCVEIAFEELCDEIANRTEDG